MNSNMAIENTDPNLEFKEWQEYLLKSVSKAYGISPSLLNKPTKSIKFSGVDLGSEEGDRTVSFTWGNRYSENDVEETLKKAQVPTEEEWRVSYNNSPENTIDIDYEEVE